MCRAYTAIMTILIRISNVPPTVEQEEDLHSLQDNKVCLRPVQLARPSARQLDHSIHRPNEDGQNGKREEADKDGESLLADVRRQRDASALLEPPHPEGIVETQRDKGSHCRDLERETGNHDVRGCSYILIALRRSRGQPTTGALQDKTEEIAGDEDHGVGLGLDPRGLDADVADHVAEREVDGGSEEGRRERDAADADEEAVEGEGVVPRQEAADVADDLGGAAERHGGEEVRLAGDGALDDVGEAGGGEEGEEGRVGGQGGAVVHYRLRDVAVREVARVDVRHDCGCGLRW